MTKKRQATALPGKFLENKKLVGEFLAKTKDVDERDELKKRETLIATVFKDFEDQQAFEVWAFGKTPMFYDERTVFCWNSRHGGSYFAQPNEVMLDSLQKMYKIYKDEHAQENHEKSSKCVSKGCKNLRKGSQSGEERRQDGRSKRSKVGV